MRCGSIASKHGMELGGLLAALPAVHVQPLTCFTACATALLLTVPLPFTCRPGHCVQVPPDLLAMANQPYAIRLRK